VCFEWNDHSGGPVIVDVDVLADYDLSGGEIKNVILNAGRNALQLQISIPKIFSDAIL